MAWNEVNLGDVSLINPARNLSKGRIAKNIPMEALGAFVRQPEKIYERSYAGGAKFMNRDTVIARITPCLENGKTAFIQGLENGEVGFGSTEYVVLSEKSGITDALFLYYLARSEAFRSFAISNMNGSSGRQRVQAEAIARYKFRLPPLEIQRKISRTLGAFDDKIELNRKMNETLEQMARAIFKSWFIDFDPVHAKAAGKKPFGMDDATAALFPDGFEQSALGAIPSGWRSEKVTNLFEVNPKYSLKRGGNHPYTEMADLPTNSASVAGARNREFSSGSRFSNGDTLIARITPCLENGKTAFVDYLSSGQIGWGSTEFIVLRSKSYFPLEASYLLARSDAFRNHLISNMTGSSGRQRAPESCLERFFLATPPGESIADKFAQSVVPLFALIRQNTVESTALAQTRDLLLPRLLSGELSVKETS